MKIAVAVDLSPESAAATRWALDLRTFYGKKNDLPEIVAISIAPSTWRSTDRAQKPTADPGLRHKMTHQVREFLEEVEPDSDFIDIHLDGGSPAELIAEYCRQNDIDWLIVGMSAQGPVGRLLWGSTAQDLVDRIHCHVAVVHPERANLAKSTDFLVGVDFHPSADDALLAAAQFAGVTGARMNLVHALPDIPVTMAPSGLASHIAPGDIARYSADARNRLENIADQLRHQYPKLDYSTAVQSGSPASVLTDFAQKRNADAIFLGNTRRKGFEGWLLGSAGRQLLKRMPATLIFIPPSANSEEED